MWSITLKLMRKTKRMLIPAGIAIMIGAAFIASTFLFGNAMKDSLIRQTTAMFGDSNYSITLDSSALNDKELNAAYATTVGDFHIDQLRGTEGVDGVRVSTETGVNVSKDGKHVSGELISTAKDKAMLPVTITQGDQPKDSNEVALPKSLAAQLDAHIGDTVDIASRTAASGDGAKAKAEQVRVVGIATDPNGAYSYYGGAIVGSDNLLALMQGADDFNTVNAMTVYLDLSENGNEVAAKTLDAVNRLLPKHFTLMAKQQAGEQNLKSLGNGADVVTQFLMCFGVLAMLVAALVIANTFQVLVAQRRRTLALLRTVGATKNQLHGSVLFEAAVLGLIASTFGVGLGVLLMWALCASGVTGQNMRLVISWQVFAVPIAFGAIMTILASLGSARSATSVTPLEALRPIETVDRRRGGIARASIGVLLIVAGIALAAVSIWRIQSADGGAADEAQYSVTLMMAIAGAASTFLGMVVTAVFWLPVLMKGVGVLAALAGPSAKVANANIRKNPRRIASTGTALLIGVTLVSTIATGAASSKQTMNDAIATRYSVDIVAVGDGISRSMADDVTGIDGVDAALYAPATVVTLDGTDDEPGGQVLLVGVRNADQVRHVMRARLDDANITPNDVLMPRYNALTGKRFAFAGGNAEFKAMHDGKAEHTLTLHAEQNDYRRVSGDYAAVGFVDERHFSDGGLDATTHMLLVKTDTDKPGVSVDNVYTQVQEALADSTNATVSGPVAERLQWAQMVDSMMMLMVGLIAVAVLIALVGVANTLSLSVIERTRESATLRAIGMTRGQLRASLAVEALLIALVSGVSGILLGTLFGWLGAYVVLEQFGTVIFPFEWGANGIVLMVSVVAALLASVLPAHRAANTPPVEALSEA